MSAAPALVVLAAGASERLGSPKAIARLVRGPGGTAVELLLAAGAELGADERPLVVTGRHDAEIRAALAEAVAAGRVELVHNARWREGRTGAVLLARAERPGRDLCLAPVDVPRVPAEVFAALARAWRDAGAPSHGWLAPAVDGRPGHPIVAGRELLSGWRPESLAEPLRMLRARAEPLWTVPVRSRAVLEDLDTPADLRDLSET